MGYSNVWFKRNFFIILIGVTAVAAAPKNHDQDRNRDDPVALPPPPRCFKRLEFSSFGGTISFRLTKNNDSPQSCADHCTRLHNDPNEGRTCRAFDYNTRTGTCRFYERSTQDQNVRLVDSVKTHVYEFDEKCWATRNAPPPSSHISACDKGSKPLMERVNGAYLLASGLAFKQVPEKQCVEECLKDETPDRHDNHKCLSVSYNRGKQVCMYLNQIARPLNKAGPPLTSDSQYKYYSKMCLPSAAAAKCPGVITRFVGKQLVAMNDAKITTANYAECVSACLTADTKLGFVCRSGMFYNRQATDNCILNYADHYEEHTLFIDGQATETDYFSLKSCHW